MPASIVKAILATGTITAFCAAASLSAHPGPEPHGPGGVIIVEGSGVEPAPNNNSNKFWKDYKSDISEAKRELRRDLARATDAEDRREAEAEYRSEIADAKKDYTEEMTERGYRVTSFRENNLRYSNR